MDLSSKVQVWRLSWICWIPNFVERLFYKKNHHSSLLLGMWMSKVSVFFKKLASPIMNPIYTCMHQQNTPPKRKHCHIVEVGLALLALASIPSKVFGWWFPCCHLLDQSYTNQSHQLWNTVETFHQIPAYESLRAFNLDAFVGLPSSILHSQTLVLVHRPHAMSWD